MSRKRKPDDRPEDADRFSGEDAPPHNPKGVAAALADTEECDDLIRKLKGTVSNAE